MANPLMRGLPTRIGIYSPYNWGEATTMAITLAEMTARFGWTPTFRPSSIAVTAPKIESVHHRWDRRMLSARVRNTRFQDWVKSVSHIVWFKFDAARLAYAKKKGRRNILVYLWHDIPDNELPLLADFERVIVPCQAAANHLLARCYLENIQVIPWDSGLPFASRAVRPVIASERRLFVVLDAETNRVCGPAIYAVLCELLSKHKNAKVAVSFVARRSQDAETIYAATQQAFATRYMVLPKMCALERAEACAVHDWVWIPSIQENAGASVLECLAHGRPVIACDVPPISEIIDDGENGRLIPCWKTGSTRQARPTYREMRDVVLDTMSDDLLWETVQRNAWSSLEQRRRRFQDAWRHLLSREPLPEEEYAEV